jgi:PBSX family phage terminase large subunit
VSILRPYDELWQGQQRFLQVEEDVTLDICIYQGGFGSGKTWIGSLLGLILACKHHGSLGLVLAKTFPMVRDTTLRTYFEHLHAWGFERDRDYLFNKSESKLVFPKWGNSEILFRHLQDPEKIKSINACWIHGEEISQFTEADFNMMVSRCRQVGYPRRRIFGTTNPQPNKGWIYQKFVQGNKGKQQIGEDVIHYRRVIAPTTDNKALPESYIENMRSQYDEQYFRINVLGEDGDYTAGLVCKTWTSANIEDTPYRPELRLYLSCDFNVDPMSWILAHRYNEEVHFIDELCIENTTTVEAAEELFRRYGNHSAGLTITGDASGQNRSTTAITALDTNYTILRNRLSELGFKDVRLDLRAANPPILDRVAAWNAMVCNSEGIVRVKVNPKCKWLIHNCDNLKFIEGTSKIWVPTPHDISKDPKSKFLGHIFDAASYLIERYYPIVLKVDDRINRRNQFKTNVFRG